MTETRILLRPEEAGERLGIGRAHVYVLLSSGELPSITLGKSRRIAVADLEAFVERKRAEAAEAALTRSGGTLRALRSA